MTRIPEVVRLESVLYDTASLAPGQSQSFFFHDRQGPEVDGSARDEHSLAEFLLTVDLARCLLARTLELNQTFAFRQKVTLPFIPNLASRPGDIDALLYDDSQSDLTIALECKRLRVRAGSEGEQRINGLSKLADAVAQVNSLQRLGFSETYLCLIAVVQDLSDRTYNFAFRACRELTFSRIVRTSLALPLAKGIGILYVEIAQPSPDPLESSAMIAAGKLKDAATHKMTSRLVELVRDCFGVHQDRGSAGAND